MHTLYANQSSTTPLARDTFDEVKKVALSFAMGGFFPRWVIRNEFNKIVASFQD